MSFQISALPPPIFSGSTSLVAPNNSKRASNSSLVTSNRWLGALYFLRGGVNNLLVACHRSTGALNKSIGALAFWLGEGSGGHVAPNNQSGAFYFLGVAGNFLIGGYTVWMFMA